jgi:beta-galactosidase
VAWQLDNEIGHEDSDICYCPRCHKAFQDYLREKFQGDIEKLNETYGTTFWSQEYNDFDEIPLPVATITTHNPALRLDWERFRSKSIVDYMEFQAKLVKEIAPKAKVMHDFPGGGLNKHVDYSQVAEKVDITAYNNYPVWGGQKVPLKPHEIAFALDHIRGMKRGTFWITEAIMGAQGHDVTGFLPRPNQAKMWSYQAMAHGCSSLMYFRYRGASKGAEQFCYGILDADNVKRRKYYEVQDFFQTIRPYAEELEMPIRPQVAILYDYDSMAAFRIQRQSILLDCQREMQKVYRTFFDRNVPVDVIPARYDFSEYQVIVLPQMIIADPQVQERVKRFAEQGGTVVLTYRTAVKDTDNNIPFGQILPVGYQKFAGIQVVETESLQSEEAFPVEGTGAFAGSKGMGGIFRDMIQDEDAEVLYRYGDKFYTSFAAVTRKKCGKGMVYYLGCGLDKAITQKIFDTIMKEQKIDTIDSDPGVEVMIRGNKDKRIWMLINHNDYEARAGKVLLEPYSCKIVNFSFNP